MASRGGGWISSRSCINTSIPQRDSSTRISKGNHLSLITKRSKKPLVRISSSDGKWHGEWNSDYIFTLRDLQLEDLAEERDTPIYIQLSIHKHAGFGLSVDGTIITSFTTKCSNCYSPYCREVHTSFKVWVLPSTRDNKGCAHQLPLLGWDDPSVIYVKPGFEADLDSLIQDTVRLATSVKETCSESCEKSVPKLQPLGKQNAASIDRRWSRLLELKKET
ncbi:large ribosomal RNA subunit accumulation protein YCED homolog 2, chloroplastic [Solanum pennellii]|uniref:Large ribosomal RNA subunit accumulation protein YCED homolog 2, chloroplastic n=1 Tax=Solanum pennellii TaxID=28526 RepID=A0ABM1G546_SOLPN|nr:large ribosomal RNA subunit accumulation protein YCED homolog 2, chloroplastic [Solanum pennellii]